MNIEAEIFNIETDLTLRFEFGAELYLMTINIGGGKYLVELANRTKLIGRRNAECKLEAERLIELVLESRKYFESYVEALEVWGQVFSFESNESNIEMVFVLRVYGKKFDQNLIGQMITEYDLKVDSEIEPKNEKGFEKMKIELTFPGRDKPIGAFIGHLLKDDFHFKINMILK